MDLHPIVSCCGRINIQNNMFDELRFRCCKIYMSTFRSLSFHILMVTRKLHILQQNNKSSNQFIVGPFFNLKNLSIQKNRPQNLCCPKTIPQNLYRKYNPCIELNKTFSRFLMQFVVK